MMQHRGSSPFRVVGKISGRTEAGSGAVVEDFLDQLASQEPLHMVHQGETPRHRLSESDFVSNRTERRRRTDKSPQNGSASSFGNPGRTRSLPSVS